MRVLEADPSIAYKMGKNRKHRIRKAKENEVEESSEDGNGCPHVSKAVNLAAMRKAVQKSAITLGECSGCIKDGSKSSSRDLFGGLIEGAPPADGDDLEPLETTVCICLQCGYQGCDRNSHNKHALKHYKTPHSGIHSIVVNLATWAAWCYICDEEVPHSPRIQGCIDFLQKQSGISKPDPVPLPGRSVESPVAEAAPVFVNTPVGKNTSPVSCMKVKGLSNLGNTCFFNAVMQSLCQTRGLENLLMDRCKAGRLYTIPAPESSKDTDVSSSDDDREEEASVKTKLSSIQTVFGDPGPVMLALLNFVQEMRGGTTRNGTVNPIALFTQVCKKAPRFKGFQQQDSHELLRYLIDSVRTEEIKRGQASILKFFKLPESISPKKVDEETKFKVKEYGRQVKHTFLDGLFGGHLVSTVKCEECKNVSQIFEAFLDLSLPVMEEKPQRPNLILIGKKKDSVSISESAEDGDATAAASAMGLDAYSEKPSKYQERKNKRVAKKDAKRKTKLHKSKSTEHQDSGGGGKGHDESAGLDQDAASEDSNKNDNDNENSSIDKDRGEEESAQPLQSGQPQETSGIRETGSRKPVVSAEKFSSGNRTADSSPEGSKDGLGANDNEDRDDPSDADIEDNIESDMSKLEISVTPGSVPQPASEHADANHVTYSNSTADQSTTYISLQGGISYTVTTHISNVEFTDSGQESNKDSILTVVKRQDDSYTVGSSHEAPTHGLTQSSQSELNSSGVVVNGDIHEKESVRHNEEQSAAVNELCTRVGELNVSANSISCEVTVNHSDVVRHNSSIYNEDKVKVVNDNNSGVITTSSVETVHEPGRFDMQRSFCSEGIPEVSATFNVSLQRSGSLDKGVFAADDLTSLCRSSHVHTKHAENDKEQVEVQISLTDEKQNEHHNRLKTQQEYMKEARNYSMSTMSPRYHPAPKECSILSCLNQFTAAELLTGSNKFGCRECTRRRRKNSHPAKADKKAKDTVYSNANKQYLIFRPPAVLTLHLKRFEQTGLTSRKVNRHVDFPLLLDLAPYCSSLCQGVKEGQTKILYSLYGVVEHSGRLTGGHYTAYIKVRPGMSPHTQFMYTHPLGPNDVLNMYLTRVLKSKEAGMAYHDGTTDRQDSGEAIDKDFEARAESLLPPGRWYHISDSRVNEVAEAEVLKAQAYLLFYERIF